MPPRQDRLCIARNVEQESCFRPPLPWKHQPEPPANRLHLRRPRLGLLVGLSLSLVALLPAYAADSSLPYWEGPLGTHLVVM
jgi:hypothetical protein